MIPWTIFPDGEPAAWDAHLVTLQGATVYQTHAWGEVKRRLGWSVLRLVAGRRECPLTMMQVLVRRYPLGGAVCWVPGGAAGDVMSWSAGLGKALRDLLPARWIYVRVNALSPAPSGSECFLVDSGWRKPAVSFSSGQSLCYNPSLPEPERVAQMSGNWRHNLKRSGKYGLVLRQWDSPDVTELRKLYRSMEEYKNLPVQISDAELAAMFECFRERILCYRCDDEDGNLLAIRACALFSDSALDLLAAASPAARKQYASHATLWALIGGCAQRGILSYDMGGVDPEGNKGVFDFKRGIGAVPYSYLGEWEWCSHGWVRPLANQALRRRGQTL